MADKTTYDTAMRSFDHTWLANYASYAPLREAINDLAYEVNDVSLDVFLNAIRDMVVTTPYADTCAKCGGTAMYWPAAVRRDGGSIRGVYQCAKGHQWTCGYAIDLPALF